MGVNGEDEFAKGCEIWDHEVHFRLAILPMKSVRMLKYGSAVSSEVYKDKEEGAATVLLSRPAAQKFCHVVKVQKGA